MVDPYAVADPYAYEDQLLGHRFLNETDGGGEEGDDGDDAGLDFEDLSGVPMLDVLRDSLKLYGSLFAVMFFLFCLGRKYYPKAYLVLSRDEEEATELSKEPHGLFSWMWKVFQVTDEELFENCGMDAVVFIRTLRYGMRVAFIGFLNGFYLFPVYALSGGDQTELEAVTLGNVPQSSPCLLAATVACYVVYLSALWLLYREFAWFTAHRHRYLTARRPDNYTVLVKFIPKELRSNAELLAYFRQVFSHDAVVDAQMALEIPTLEKASAEREALCGTDESIGKLEHAINVLTVKGNRPRHKKIVIPELPDSLALPDSVMVGSKKESGSEEKKKKKRGCCSGNPAPAETVDSIDEYTSQLDELNGRIGKLMTEIDSKNNDGMDSFKADLEEAMSVRVDGATSSKEISDTARTMTMEDTEEENSGPGEDGASHGGESNSGASFLGRLLLGSSTALEGMDKVPEEIREDTVEVIAEEPDPPLANEEAQPAWEARYEELKGATEDSSKSSKKKKKKKGFLHLKNISERTTDVTGGALSSAKLLTDGASGVAGGALSLMKGKEEGTPRDAGFVSFSSLKTKAAALQMIHHPTPFTMEVVEAPLPEHIFWKNVGLRHKTQQIGTVVAFALTATLCAFWTVIVAFLASFTNVDQLAEWFPFLEDWMEKAPWLEAALNQIKPLFIVLLVNLLFPILSNFSRREGHISHTSLSASAFTKLAWFLIIQIFFVQMLSGSITSEIANIANDPTSVIELMATALPEQAQSFMQYVIVQTALNLGSEILRPVDIVKAWVRSCIGPTLTEEEAAKPWHGLEPFEIVPEFEFGDFQATLILYYLILFTYSVMSPVTSIVVGIAFFIFSMCFRNQLIYLYTKSNDSGGQLFGKFVSLTSSCLLISVLVMFGVLLLKGGALAAPLVIPVLVAVIAFKIYVNQQHYLVTKHVPSTIAVEEDIHNIGQIDFDELVKGVYKQPARQVRHLEPENMSEIRDVETDSRVFLTPDHSEAEIVEP